MVLQWSICKRIPRNINGQIRQSKFCAEYWFGYWEARWQLHVPSNKYRRIIEFYLWTDCQGYWISSAYVIIFRFLIIFQLFCIWVFALTFSLCPNLFFVTPKICKLFDYLYFIAYECIVPPKIAPFDFGSEPSNFADSASVACLAVHGDTPIAFKWFFNDRPVKEYSGITTVKLGNRNSVLNIDSVTGKHAGRYTCQASNEAASFNYTAELIVNGTKNQRHETCSVHVENAPLYFNSL